ncbi:MAG: LysR family transcriptional regulator, partial [Phycisphaerae bacterium]|nr:LysR family transcriptional regulator [Phycisphaerae bacterium]
SKSPSHSARLNPPAQLHGRLWIDIGKSPALTEAGADLLEQIEACGSLSEAARRLCFSYRRAWLLTDTMNRLWPEPLVQTAIGGKSGGGTIVTEQGHRVLLAYRDLQLQLEHLLDQATEAFRLLTSS